MSEATKFTPGPWRYQEESDAYTHIVRAGEHYFVCQLPQDTSGKAEANARLIAAAPDMLTILNECADFVQPFNRASDLLDRIEAVIAKAEGTQP
jgi:hypothetical protein